MYYKILIYCITKTRDKLITHFLIKKKKLITHFYNTTSNFIMINPKLDCPIIMRLENLFNYIQSVYCGVHKTV